MDELMDDVVEGILLRLPPADPASLVRAALVCRRWRRLISYRGFRRRFVELHRHPPTLGFFHRMWRQWTRFLPAASSFLLPYADAVPAHWRAMDARHGRVLYSDGGGDLVVSCPMTGDARKLPMPPPPHTSEKYYNWNVAVLCAAPGGCDHVDCCPRGPFAVVAVVTNEPKLSTCACVYSSETSAWRVAACVEHPDGCVLRVSPLLAAGNALYFDFDLSTRSSSVKILEYDLGKQELSFIDLPRKVATQPVLLVENDGRLGIAAVVRRSKVHVWLRDDTAGQSGRGWAWNRAIDLQGLFLCPDISAASTSPHLLAFVDGTAAVSVCVPSVGVFNLHIKSGLVTKVSDGIVGYSGFLPYTGFYIPSVGSSLRAREG